MRARYRGVRQLKDAAALRAHIADAGIDLDFDDEIEVGPAAPLAAPMAVGRFTVGNRFTVLPMEGWDGTEDGAPSELTERRWRRFGASGAKLIWGGEAAAVAASGRANPRQLLVSGALAPLREALVAEHERRYGTADDLLVGLQLTHSGRFSRPAPPVVAYAHPHMRVHGDVISDDELDDLVGAFVVAAAVARDAGFDFVDVKHCHGYLGHELLSAYDRPGRYGGSFENRTRFLRSVVEGIGGSIMVGVRFSAADFAPFSPGPDGVGSPVSNGAGYRYAFGGDGTGVGVDLTEPKRFLDLLGELGVPLACVTLGSPYYNPHIQRPALFPPSDGYAPPEDPLAGVARQLAVTAELKAHAPGLVVVGSGYSYLQDWIGHVAQREVRLGRVDSVGLGRMALSYPELPADLLAGHPLDRHRVCRTLSDCTTAPRNGLVSGCYPLDDFYGARPERVTLAAVKKERR